MRYLALLILSLILAVPVAANAQASPLSEQDAQLLQDAAVTGSFEIQASQIALQSATQERVKEFARLMLLEHELISADLKSIADAKKVVLPNDLDNETRDQLSELQQLKGPDFDKRFIEYVAVGAHKKALERFRTVHKQTNDAQIRTFAAETAERLQQHLDEANKVAQETNTSTP